jgi:hypothetical protein
VEIFEKEDEEDIYIESTRNAKRKEGWQWLRWADSRSFQTA